MSEIENAVDENDKFIINQENAEYIVENKRELIIKWSAHLNRADISEESLNELKDRIERANKVIDEVQSLYPETVL